MSRDSGFVTRGSWMVHGNTNSEARNPKQIRILKYSNIKAGPQSRDRPFWVGQVLLLRREWLADKVGVDKDDEMPEWPEGKKLRIWELCFWGIYVLAHGIPGFGKSLLSLLGRFLWKGPPGYRFSIS